MRNLGYKSRWLPRNWLNPALFWGGGKTTNRDSISVYIFRPTKSNVDNFDHNYDFNAKVIVIGLRVKRSHNFIPRVMRK